MRNLKKFLALVLAFVMAMSLMVTVNAASSDFADSEEINEKFAEAVEVLTGMGVFKGTDEDGTLEFKPQSNVTRAQMAAVVYRLATGDAEDARAPLYSKYANFTDVSKDAWYAGYVGYCADAQIIVGYSDNSFKPNKPVSGYEALKMLLCAVGWGQNKEFEGEGWTIRVGSTATGEGLLGNVNSSTYDRTLNDIANREMLAEISFRAALAPTVVYQYGSYNKYNNLINQDADHLNPSLGLKYYGLTRHTGIILGNQATGEEYTKIGFQVDPVTNNNGDLVSASINDTFEKEAYYYESDAATAENVTLAFDWQSGLEDFGHAVDVWYDCRGNGRDVESVGLTGHGHIEFATKLTTYAVTDKATLVGLVNDGANTDGTVNANNAKLGETAVKAGFKVAASGHNAYFNYAFAPMKAANYGTSIAAGSAASPVLENDGTTKYPLYLLISNSSDKNLDLVISLDLTVTKITQTNTTKAPYTVGVLATNDENGTNASTSANKYFGTDADISAGTDKTYRQLLDANILGDSTKTLGKPVVAFEITGTAGDGTAAAGTAGMATQPDNSSLTSTFYYYLAELTHVEKYTAVARNASDESITLSDGTKLERSPLALAVDAGFQKNARVKAPTSYGEYNFTLDQDGKYIYWEPITTEAQFVYGTYLDYVSGAATSSFTYPFVGVDMNGEIFQKNVNSYTTFATPNTAVTLGKDDNAYDGIPLPKRDANNTSGQVQKGVYVGYLVDEDGNLTYVGANTAGTNVKQATATDFGEAAITMTSGTNPVKMGAVQVGNSDLYLTNETQFYLVSGAGTDTQTVKSVKGIAGLMDGNSSVTIDASAINAGDRYLKETLSKTGASTAAPAGTTDDGTRSYNMVYYTSSKFDYAQDYTASSQQVDMVFIPEELVDMNPVVDSNLVFVGDATPGLLNSGNKAATQFTMYQNGTEVKVWIAGVVDGTWSSDGTLDNSADTICELGENVFYRLKPTTDKAADGQIIYNVVEVTNATRSVIGQYFDGTATIGEANMADTGEVPLFRATNYNSNLAFIDTTSSLATTTKLYNVGDAFVKNLDEKGFPGVDSLATLRNAGSLTDDGGVPVSCVLNGKDATVVDVIYVNAPVTP